MVQQYVLLANGSQQIAGALQCPRQAGSERLKFQRAGIHHVGQWHQSNQIDRPLHGIEVLRCQVELPK